MPSNLKTDLDGVNSANLSHLYEGRLRGELLCFAGMIRQRCCSCPLRLTLIICMRFTVIWTLKHDPSFFDPW